MNKDERLLKYLHEHPGEIARMELKIQEDSEVLSEENITRITSFGIEKEKLNIERADKIFELWKELHTYQEIAEVFDLTRERVRQIIMKYHGDEFNVMKGGILKKRREAINKKMDSREWVCERCGEKFQKRTQTKFCTRDCFRKSKMIVEYPDWVAGRRINQENFTEWEWKEINRIRTNSYYHRHRDRLNAVARQWRKDNKERFALYQKRSQERRLCGEAITDLPNPINIKAMKDAQNSKELLAQCTCNAVKYMDKSVERWQPSIAHFPLLPMEKCHTCKKLKI